ncbi:hypothetical protein HOF78_01515 [Candidatus Woesearchaeota archaeon]|jgi:isopentenyldiphosphate isomerase|nr:hypothetical protein [Candidatus Woesearchaeota archaeon]MBT6044818.1 hypothetical protein [Candidatus Woesearchaeota archaeon]
MKIQTYRQVDNWDKGTELYEGDVLEKALVHNEGLLHKSAHLLIVNSQGEILCRKRSNSEKRYSSLWTTTIGTHVELGLNYLETLRRNMPSEMVTKFLGEFRVKDLFENEICGLHVTLFESKTIPDDFLKDRCFFNRDDLEESISEGRTTPHLTEATRLLGEK